MKTKTALKLIACALCALGLGTALSACGQGEAPSDGSGSTAASAPAYTSEAEGEYAAGIHHAVVQVEGYPAFTIELDADAAPVAVANFCDLAGRGYYDGLTFYRIEEDIILGGTTGNDFTARDPTLTPIVGEFQVNGVNNPLSDSFKRGYVGMMHTDNLNSATSTFFITLVGPDKIAIRLSGRYAAFGIIDDQDMEVVDQIATDYAQYAEGDMGIIEDEANMPIIESIEIVD